MTKTKGESPEDPSAPIDAQNAESQKKGLDESLIPVDEHFEEVHEGGKKVTHKGVFLLPNLLTTGALFSGFYAIIAAIQLQFEPAAIAMFAAMVLDGMDGRVARLTNTSSEFGVQYDSLSDLVSFGVAPSLLLFNWALVQLGKFGWAVSFAYIACAALRLARFNAQAKVTDKRFFIGLASPAAAALIASMVWVGHDAEPGKIFAYFTAVVALGVALLMVSNVRYQSFKGVDLKSRVPFVFILALVLLFTVITIDPPKVLLLMACLYAFSGPLQVLARWGLRVAKGKPAA